jgi:hypothetical protein
MKIRIVFIAIASLAIACNGQSSNPQVDKKAVEDSLYKAVEEGHNVGMAKMAILRRSRGMVELQLDSMGKLPAAKIDTVYRNTLLSVQQDLNDAETNMNLWMENFKFDSAKDNPDLRIKYLEGEKVIVTKVRDKILNGLKRADSVLVK